MITTDLLANGSDVKDIEPTGQLKAITMRMPTSFSQQHACDLYTSTLGNTFTQNFQALANHPISQYMEVFANNITSFGNTSYGSTTKGSEVYDTERTLQGVGECLASMLDNSLFAFSSA